jgi:hypothetical protein
VAVPAPAGLALQVYPNPSSAGTAAPAVLVRAARPGAATLTVTDALGRPVLVRRLALNAGANAQALPEVAQWPAGVYVLRVQQAGQQQTQKLVRE